ncbi:MAG TPA: prolyl oligopeptidase family serine peptidase [Patescibacteria group bacterium]|nr:prolyl oligopeptidase family serine peptidase [Patescibacteria group bacterium]
MYKVKFQKIGKIAGMHYTKKKKPDTLIIYGIGAPIPPDNGTLPDAKIIYQFEVDIFVPDYIGFGRSDGRFTPKNCIQTFIILFHAFSKGYWAKNAYDNSKVFLQYKRIIFIGRSLGATYVPLLPRFCPEIKEIAIFCPVVDSKSCGSVQGEESNEDFLRSMKQDGYYHLYRGILTKEWENHLENKDDLSPMENISFLKDAKLFIGHGKKDVCVNFTKSEVYYQKIIQMFPQKKHEVVLKIYPKGDHGPTTTNKAVFDFLMWLKLKKITMVE